MKKFKLHRAYIIIGSSLALLSLIGYFSYKLFFSHASIAEITAACPQDTMICPDGTKISRSDPSCNFICPSNTVAISACSLELMICPDGTGVGRTGPNCSFPSCPKPSLSSVISFNPSSPTISDTSPQTIQLQIFSNNLFVTGAEIELNFDKSLISIDKVEPSSDFPSILSAPRINAGQINFAYGISTAAYVMLNSSTTPLQTDVTISPVEREQLYNNGGICPQISGQCIGKDGSSCVTYNNYCDRPKLCALPIISCASRGNEKRPLTIATITYHLLSTPTTTPVQTILATTDNTKVSAIDSDSNVITSTSSAKLILQSSHLPGDLNDDGSVNLFDFNLLVTKFNNPFTIFDFSAIVANYGKNR